MLAGLSGDEKIVIEGGSMLFQGSKVEVIKTTARSDDGEAGGVDGQGG